MKQGKSAGIRGLSRGVTVFGAVIAFMGLAACSPAPSDHSPSSATSLTSSGTDTAPSDSGSSNDNAGSSDSDKVDQVINLETELDQFRGELITLNVASATPAIEFTGDIDAHADFYSERGGNAVLDDGRAITIWGQLPNGDYVASATQDENGNVVSDFGALNNDGEFAAFGGREATPGYVIAAAILGDHVAWVISTDEIMFPFSWDMYVWDGSTDVGVADASVVPDGTGLVPWSVGVNEDGQASFVTVSGDSEFYYHVADGETFLSNPDIPARSSQHPISVGSGFLYAEQQKNATVISYQGLSMEDPSTVSRNLFTVAGPVSQDTPLIGTAELMGLQYNQGIYAQKPHWFAINNDKTRLVALDMTGHEPSSSMVCGTQLVWMTFDGEQNSNVLYHVDTAAQEPTVRYIDLIDPGTFVCGSEHTIIYSGLDMESGNSFYWNYTFDAGV